MRAWLNWKSVVSSIVLGLVFAFSLFLWTGRQFSLSGLDLFFAITTVISIAFNLWQLFRDQYKYDPLKNSLIALFNGLKGRQLRCVERRQMLTSPSSLAADANAMRREFYDFVGETTQTLDQLKEHVVGAIHTLGPTISNEQIFRAAEFGLN